MNSRAKDIGVGVFLALIGVVALVFAGLIVGGLAIGVGVLAGSIRFRRGSGSIDALRVAIVIGVISFTLVLAAVTFVVVPSKMDQPDSEPVRTGESPPLSR